jgi:small basic protein
MMVRYISAYGGIAGLLLGIVITLVYDLPISDAAYRLLVLSICGAWMGAILSWLNHLLPQSEEIKSTETENQ